MNRLPVVGRPHEAKVVIPVLRPNTPGGTPCVGIKSVDIGFDWDNNKLFLVPEHQITLLSAEDVAAIHADAKRENSREGYAAYTRIKHLETLLKENGIPYEAS